MVNTTDNVALNRLSLMNLLPDPSSFILLIEAGYGSLQGGSESVKVVPRTSSDSTSI